MVLGGSNMADLRILALTSCACWMAACGSGNTENGSELPDTTLPSVDPGLPLILYTDMVSAPASAYITLWGHGFGSAQGTSTVTLGGLDMDRYVSWSDDKIELKLPAAAASGSLVIHSMPFRRLQRPVTP